MAFRVTNEQEYTLEECIVCGCVYAVTKTFQKTRQEDCKAFYCPNGHSQSYTKSTSEQLRENLADTKRELADRITEIHALHNDLDKANRMLEASKKRKQK